MTPQSAPTISDDERAALQAGLAEARRRGTKLSAAKRPGARIRAQLFLNIEEHTAIGLTGNVLSLHMGRPISRAISTRLALYRLTQDAKRSLTDPALAARLKAEMLAVREETAK